MKDLLKILATIFLTGFGLNLAWEVVQSLLFFDFPLVPLKFFILIHLKASSADAGYIVLIYLFVTVLTRKLKWFCHLTLFRILITMSTGFVIAMHIERNALETGRWSYGQLMPIIPFLQVGLMPVMQMTILPLVTFMLSQKLVVAQERAPQAGPLRREF